MPLEYKPKVKFFISTKAELATDKVNEWLEDNYDNIDVMSIQPFMSYTEMKDRGAYMIGCMVTYLDATKEPDEEIEIVPFEQPILNPEVISTK